MPSLLSGSHGNLSAPTNFANIGNLQYKLGPTPSTSTGYTIISDAESKTVFASSLGNLQFTSGTIYSNILNQNIQFVGTGTGTVVVSGPQLNTSTNTGVLVVQGGIGISAGLYTGQDIYVNGLQIGQGYQGYNNIVIRGVASTLGQNATDGENSLAIGYNTLAGINSALNTIALGNYALGTGTDIANTIAIGNGSLNSAGTIQSILVGSISAITTGATTVVTVPSHGLSTGTEIVINGVVGTTELNNNKYLVNPVTPNTLELFSIYDPNLATPVTTIHTYVNSGTVSRTWTTENNIAIGINAAPSFYEGVDNFFIGNNVSGQFTTGSYNLFMGHAAVGNMTNGNFNISIDSNRLVDGRNSQLGIGTIFYYNGGGFLELDTNVGLGLGDEASDTTSTGALNVYGGVGISKSLYVGKNLSVQGSGNVTLSPIGGSVIMEPQAGGTVTIYPESGTPGNMDNMYIGSYQPRNGQFLDLRSQTLEVSSTASSTSTITGALTVAGGVGIGGSVYSQNGNTQENYLLYSPKVSVSSTIPTTATNHVGDIWIDLNSLSYYQWINDGGNKFWLQITTL